jgi:ADP-L-glycero-D-manno-heptose 6-epimerase
MASVIFHTHKQILETGKMNLFKSHRPDYLDGHQLRDFVYVKDVLKVIYFLMQNRPSSGIFNLGTGVARSFLDLATNTFVGMGLEPTIEFVDMPLDIRDTYQYFTEADMSKLNHTGYDTPFYSLEEGVNDYVTGYLMPHNYL